MVLDGRLEILVLRVEGTRSTRGIMNLSGGVVSCTILGSVMRPAEERIHPVAQFYKLHDLRCVAWTVIASW
jgi:hypothetical protein